MIFVKMEVFCHTYENIHKSNFLSLYNDTVQKSILRTKFISYAKKREFDSYKIEKHRKAA